jgi:hypothetical protein
MRNVGGVLRCGRFFDAEVAETALVRKAFHQGGPGDCCGQGGF